MKLLRTYGWETRKLARQKRTWAGLGAAVLYALAFVVALTVKKHAGIPPEIPLAHQLTQSGVVLPLALIAFVTYLGAPSISALVAGDIVSSEDANNTLKMILTRSTERGTIDALDALAYATYLLPLAVLVSVAFFLSTATRNSAAAIVGTLIFTLAFEGIAALPGLEGAKPYLLPQQFDAWQALFGKSGVSISRAAWTCAIYSLLPLAGGWWIFSRRDVAGA